MPARSGEVVGSNPPHPRGRFHATGPVIFDCKKGKGELSRTMAVFIGQFVLTADLLNKIAVPLLKKQYPFLQEIAFRVTDDFVVAEVRGNYSLIGFRAFAAVRLREFIFEPGSYHIELQLSLAMQPRLLKPLLVELLKKRFTQQPGVDWEGDSLRFEPAVMPFFLQLMEEQTLKEIFLKLEIRRGEGDDRGMAFNLYLHGKDKGREQP